MGLSWLLFAQLFCAPVKIEYPEHLKWDKVEYAALGEAARHCYTYKYPRNPCLRFFIRFEPIPGHYRRHYAECGIEDVGNRLNWNDRYIPPSW